MPTIEETEARLATYRERLAKLDKNSVEARFVEGWLIRGALNDLSLLRAMAALDRGEGKPL